MDGKTRETAGLSLCPPLINFKAYSEGERQGRVVIKKPTKKKPTLKQQRFVEGVVRHGNATRAAREAGYKHPNVQGAQNLVKLSISEAVERRKAEAMRRSQIHTDIIVGSLAEISTASIGDVLDENGDFDLQKCREKGTDHLLKKVTKTERHSKDGSSRVTYSYEMYSRLDALQQLRDNFGMKQEAKPNHQAEVESAISDFIRKAQEKGYEVSYEEARGYIEPRLESEMVN